MLRYVKFSNYEIFTTWTNLFHRNTEPVDVAFVFEGYGAVAVGRSVRFYTDKFLRFFGEVHRSDALRIYAL